MTSLKNITKTLGAFAAATCLSAAPMFSVSAVGSSSYFDNNSANCVIEAYNTENSMSVTNIADVEFDKVKNVNCQSRGMTNFRGVVLLTNLERLNVAGNPNLNLYDMKFDYNTKLKEINLGSLNGYSLDFSKNTELEQITHTGELYLKTSAYVVKGDNGYKMDLSGLKFIDATASLIENADYPATYDGESKIVSFDGKAGYTINMSVGGYGLFIKTRGGNMNYRVFLRGDEEVESHGSYYLQNGCEWEEADNDYGGYYRCNSSVFYGDTIDTDEIIDSTLRSIFNLANYSLKEVKIVPPTANLDLTEDTDLRKKGTILTEADFQIDFYFELSDGENLPGAPNTGLMFGNIEGMKKIAFIAVPAMVVLGFVVKFAIGRKNKKVKFSKR